MHFFVLLTFSILALQVIFLGLFIYAFSKKPGIKPGTALPAISVIVAAHDEEENLRELLPRLLDQDHPEFELIVVEDRCNDGTYDYLLEATKQYPRLKMVRVVQKPEHIHGKKFALTLGIKAAKYDWVLLTDADCRPATKSWIRRMAEQAVDPAQLVIGFSPYMKCPGLLNSLIRFESFLTGIQFIGMALLGKPYMGVGRNLAYRKSLFLENKGFNGHLDVTGGDDDLFVNRHATAANTKVCIGADALVMSKPKNSWTSFYFQKLRHLSVGKHYKFSDKIILGFFSLSWVLLWLMIMPAVIFGPLREWVVSAFLLRWILLIVLFHRVPRRLGDSFEAWKVPFLDFIYAFYYLVAGLVALVSKKVRWKM